MILCLTASLLASASFSPGEEIQVLPVSRTPESNAIVLAIAVPKAGEIKERNPVWVQFRLDGYALGSGSPSDRTKELNLSKMGQTVHVIIDNEPYFAVNDPSIDPFNEDGYYYDSSYKFKIPYTLKPGVHTIRMFPARSYGESLKNENTFQATYFYVGNQTGVPDANLKEPYLTYNEPDTHITLTQDKPVLLDFYVRNCELSSDGYKVFLTIDGSNRRTLASWQPYYIYGLSKGKHTIRLQLMSPKGVQVPGSFNDVERTIQIR
jgi:hypothetical protein